jgi:23S rRNA (cytidine1920-2'-O)/16S rRNA (cytidine1409-2'-O)-methyltransferase
VALVKPQFEAGRHDVERGGIVSDPAVHQRVLAEIAAAAAKVGLAPAGMIESPITGAEGNREFLLHLRPTSGRVANLAPGAGRRPARVKRAS